MLLSTERLTKYKTETLDHVIGAICELYVDDLFWNIQFLLTESTQSNFNTAFLISHFSLGEPDPDKQRLPVALTMKNKKNLSKLSESLLHMLSPKDYVTNAKNLAKLMHDIDHGEKTVLTKLGSHLRSRKKIIELKIEAVDGYVGKVADLIFEPDNWKVRYFVVQSQISAQKSKHVLLSPSWVKKIIWNKNEIFVDFSRDVIRNSPSIEFGKSVDNQFELELIRYYRNKKN